MPSFHALTIGQGVALNAPAADGSADQVMVTDGSATLTFAYPMEIGKKAQSGTAGSVLFVDASGNLGQDNAKLFYDDANNELLLGTTASTSAGSHCQVLVGGSQYATPLMFMDRETDATAKAGFFVGPRMTNANAPFTGFGTWDNGSAREIYFGGGNWNRVDATSIRFWTAPTYTETINQGVERFTISTARQDINTNGGDYDTRIRSQNDNNFVVVDAATDNLGVAVTGQTVTGTAHFFPYAVGDDLLTLQQITSHTGKILNLKDSGGTSVGDVDKDGILTIHSRRSATKIVAKSGAYTAAAGELVVCTAGTSYSITLPASPVKNDSVGILLKSVTGTSEITIAPNGNDIDGVAFGSVVYKLFVADDTLGLHDYVELQYDGTEWWTVDDGRVGHRAHMHLNASITTNTAATPKKITFDTEIFDVGGIGDPTTNNRFDIRRAGHYKVSLQFRSNSTITASNYYGGYIYKNGSANSQNFIYAGVTSNIFVVQSKGIDCSAGDYIEGYFNPQETNKGVKSANSITYMVVEEMR